MKKKIAPVPIMDDLFAPKKEAHPFSHRSIVITGNLIQSTNEIKNWINNLGGTIRQSVSKNINYIIIGDTPDPDEISLFSKLKYNGFHLKPIYQEDINRLQSGSYRVEDYCTESKTTKDLKISHSHIIDNLIKVDFLSRNPIASKELFFGNEFSGNRDRLLQMCGNLGAFSNNKLSDGIDICFLSDSTIRKLSVGETDDTIAYIENYYNTSDAINFGYNFIVESDFLESCYKRCVKFDDQVTLDLYKRYHE